MATGLNHMHAFERVIISRHLFTFLRQLQQCIVNVQMNRQHNVTEAIQQCRQVCLFYLFLCTYNINKGVIVIYELL